MYAAIEMMEAGNTTADVAEENVLVTKNGPVLFTRHPFDANALS
jgi:hypothetical protein